MSEKNAIVQPRDTSLNDDCSRGFGNAAEDVMMNRDLLSRIPDENPNPEISFGQVNQGNKTPVCDSSVLESGEIKNTVIQNGSQATGGFPYLDLHGSTVSQTGIQTPSSFGDLGNGRLTASATCFSDYGSQAIGWVPYQDWHGSTVSQTGIETRSSFGDLGNGRLRPSATCVPDYGSQAIGLFPYLGWHGSRVLQTGIETPSTFDDLGNGRSRPSVTYFSGYLDSHGSTVSQTGIEPPSSFGDLGNGRLRPSSTCFLDYGPQATGRFPYLDPYGSGVLQTVIGTPSSFGDLGNGRSRPRATCFPSHGRNVVSYPVNCRPWMPTMIPPHFNIMPRNYSGIGAAQNSSLMSQLSHNYSSIGACAGNCALPEPYGHNTMGAPLSEVSPNFVTGQLFPNKEEHINNLDKHVAEQRSEHSLVSQDFHNCGGLKFEPNKGNMIFLPELQDLPRTSYKASPPDGVLTVSLLPHQQLALTWMSYKETSGNPCFGGILADDQGLGKTVSTIALIVTERSTPSLQWKEDSKNEGSYENKVGEDGNLKRLPEAGTLIVCPTSLMRQWADEIGKKISREANLSVLVYQGYYRTMDPHELAKYDVVITTYSLVSMEISKPPLDRADEGIHDGGVESAGFGSNKKDSPNSRKKRTKKRKHMDCEPVLSGPLSQVSWFRIVLDEAQSIKNHETRAAMACSGLHAKRRWCLSGTPIQNSIDDLYSYLRFLKFDPYSRFQTFCEKIKVPITRYPEQGYQTLRPILKDIMLRRTKDTILDGKPIISIPPKSIELKRVDFTKEERDFYSKLECYYCDQYKEYEKAGTVEQNYVNILSMLLRLRQACDHPLLVLNSSWASSTEVAKKLPYEKLTFLMHLLKASPAICSICNDPPKDAVVSICGHVFCKQCICECLTSDSDQCPLPNCKAGLEISSLFSRETLENAMFSGLHKLAAPCDRTTSVLVGSGETGIKNFPSGSSKINAALDILQSVNRPTPTTLMNDSNHHLDKSSSLPATPAKNNMDDLIKVGGEKAIVFTQWTKMLDLLEVCLKGKRIQYRRFDGKMTVAARDAAVQDFNTLPEVSVIIMSLKAACLGLNLVAACHVLILDLWWNPTTEDQAIDRAHRIGQTRPVKVVRFTVKDTIEDRILGLQKKKRTMVASALGEDETGSQQPHLSVEDLNYLFDIRAQLQQPGPAQQQK